MFFFLIQTASIFILGGEDGNTAVIVGILIPILVVAILGAVLFFIWRR